MLSRRRDRTFTLGFVALSYAIAFWQRPGLATSDTKIDLHVAPVRFLSNVASVWTPSTDLGEVHAAQYSGYLWPMGPFFALFHELGVSPWVVQRLWYGLMLTLAAWGALRLLDVLIGRPRGIVHFVATAFFTINPYTVVFSARTTITLLGYAALPWLLYAIQRGLQDHRGWRAWWWPAAFALMFMSTGGGVNAAVLGWMSVGPLLLLIYEPVAGHVPWRAAGAFLLRAGVLSVLASLWWIAALLVHVRYGIDFLRYTEQPSTIWNTNSISESIRLMGYWTSYIGVGYFGANRTYFSDSTTMLSVPVVLCSQILPALAVLGFVWTRRQRYAPFFVTLVVVGVTIMAAGFPNDTPMRSAMDWVYYHVFVLRFMRTTNKAAPLLVLGLAVLLGLAARSAWGWVRGLDRHRVRRVAMLATPMLGAAIIVIASWPLFQGKAIDKQLTWKRIPTAWQQAGAALNRHLPLNSRAIVLPGQIFAYYNWGGTIDSILPRLTTRPVAVRYETPYSDLHADDLLLTIDSLVQQNRLFPGQLRPLLGLIGVGSVITATDDDRSRSGAVDPGTAALALSQQRLGRAVPYGPISAVPPGVGDIDAVKLLPQVRRYPISSGRSIVHVDPSGPQTVVDGSAEGLAQLAAFGALPGRAPIFYAGDLSPDAIRRAAASGGDIVVTDSNRRRYFLPQYTQQDVGPTQTASDGFGRNTAVVDPFSNTGSDAQTVAVLRGARYIQAPNVPAFSAFPEHSGVAAFDGDLSTSWVADNSEPPSNRYVEIGFTKPRDVSYIDVYPLSGHHGVVSAVEVNGRTVRVGLGWTRIAVNAHMISHLRVRVAHVIQPHNRHGGPGGFREVRIPGVHVSEALRLPLLSYRSLSGQDIAHARLTYLLSRTTADDPFRRDRYVGDPIQGKIADRQDPERQLDRILPMPTSRKFSADAWVAPGVDQPDSALDRLTGLRGTGAFTSSSRFHNQPRFRASSAFDKDPSSAWVSLWIRETSPDPWIAWSTTAPQTITRLHITAPRLPQPVRVPTMVQLSWPGGSTPSLPVGADGGVLLPTPVRSASFRLTVREAQFPAGTAISQETTRAVGIGSLTGSGVPNVVVPREGLLHAGCGSASVDLSGHYFPLRPTGTVAQLDAGQPLRAFACAKPVRLGPGYQEVRSLPGVFTVDLLRLSASPEQPVSTPMASAEVISPGHLGAYSVTGTNLRLGAPSWLVLGESYDIGWRAACDGHSLGVPRVIDGFANGWLAPAGCRKASFFFSPQSGVNRSYVISAIVCALLVLFLILGRPARRPETADVRVPLPAGHHRRLPLPRALLIGAAMALLLGFVFAWRTGPPIFLAVVLILWRGVPPQRLAVASAGLLGVVIPIIYLITTHQGGEDFDYSVELIYAHWIGVAAVVLFGMSGWRTMSAARAPRKPPPPPPEPVLTRTQDHQAFRGPVGAER